MVIGCEPISEKRATIPRWIEAQRAVVDQVFVAKPEPGNALPQEIGGLVRDEAGVTMIDEALRQPLAQSDPPVSCRQRYHVAVRGDRASVESATSLRPPERPKSVYLWLHCVGIGGGRRLLSASRSRKTTLSESEPRCPILP